MSNEDKYKIFFEAAVDTWKFQVDSYWTRTSYFAVFELAFAAGLWRLFDTKHFITSAGMPVGAILVTIIWFVNN